MSTVPQPPSFFPTTALDHAAAGLGAGIATTLCMNPLDLLKIKLQVTTTRPAGGIGKQIWLSLKDIQQTQGWRGLYRGLVPNIAGNASSWGLYFLFYNMLKKRASGGDITKPLSAAEYLICSAQASPHFPLFPRSAPFNPSYGLHRPVRMFTTRADAPTAYRGLWDGLSTIVRKEGPLGLLRGTSLALFGVSNGAIQFVVYEKMKAWGFDRKRKQYERAGKVYDVEADKLVCLALLRLQLLWGPFH
ncbi:hypothetical protein NLJ89_g11124 [Agrocybe chaxingu]|uniref:Uncharacterized protein n=1 Tax=Agrocybe chaxingu TaxID=84603 RepID=A0A9W8MRX5_9AGAR|nr:hypothetical protein NLJ89_g11124 [Agrocybe chaxingu]